MCQNFHQNFTQKCKVNFYDTWHHIHTYMYFIIYDAMSYK